MGITTNKGAFAVVTAYLLLAGSLNSLPMVEAGPGSHARSTERGQVGDMVKKMPPPPSVTYPCPFIASMLSIARYYVTGVNQLALNAWINGIQVTMSSMNGNSSFDLEDIVVVVGASLQTFLATHPSISVSISLAPLNQSSGQLWGSVWDFIYSGILISAENAPSAISPNSSTGQSPLTSAISSAANATGNSSVVQESESLIAQITLILNSGQYNEGEKLSILGQLFTVEYPDFIPFLNNITISPSLGPLSQILAALKVYTQTYSVSLYLSGSNSTNCTLFQDLTALSKSCGSGSGNKTTCTAVKSLITTITSAGFFTTTDYLARLEIVSTAIFNLAQTNPAIYLLVLPGFNFLTIYDLEFTSNIVTITGANATTVAPKPTVSGGPTPTPAVTQTVVPPTLPPGANVTCPCPAGSAGFVVDFDPLTQEFFDSILLDLPNLSVCPCGGGQVQVCFPSAPSSSFSIEVAITLECPGLQSPPGPPGPNPPPGSHPAPNPGPGSPCVCDESGNCFQELKSPKGPGSHGSHETLSQLLFVPFCDGGGCHIYVLPYCFAADTSGGDGLKSANGKSYACSDVIDPATKKPHPIGTGSPYLVAFSASCRSCGFIQPVVKSACGTP